jgi:glycosyltransferase involved in cell wall biosynthesis
VNAVFVSARLDAPDSALMLVDLVGDFAAHYGPAATHLVAPAAADHVDRLRADGVHVHLPSGSDERNLVLTRSDFVLLNGAGVDEGHRRTILKALQAGRLERAYWLIHEDVRDLPAVAPSLADAALRRRLVELINSGRLVVLVPSARLKAQYDELLGDDVVTSFPARITLPDAFVPDRSVADYTAINFLSVSSSSDGRDGQLIVAFAFQELMTRGLADDPPLYRPFKLTLVGVGSDYVSDQVGTIAEAAAGGRLETFPHVDHDTAFAISAGCNVAISCSLSAAFPRWVTEAMAMGHVVLHNGAGGRDEQLAEGKNGYLVDSGDVSQVARVVERLLNRETTSDAALHAMGSASRAMSAPSAGGSYVEYFER